MGVREKSSPFIRKNTPNFFDPSYFEAALSLFCREYFTLCFSELKIKIQVPILFVISAMSGRKYGTKRLFPTVVILCSDGMKHLFWLCLGKVAQNILSVRNCSPN